jgi:hypothetical protein
LAALIGLALHACARPPDRASDVRIELRLTPDPPVLGPAQVEVTLAGPSGSPVTGATVRVEGTMTHPGMTPSIASAAEVEPGRYRAPLELTMRGDWVVLVEARLADGRRAERTLDVRGVK